MFDFRFFLSSSFPKFPLSLSLPPESRRPAISGVVLTLMAESESTVRPVGFKSTNPHCNGPQA